jgi:hypothetical protein
MISLTLGIVDFGANDDPVAADAALARDDRLRHASASTHGGSSRSTADRRVRERRRIHVPEPDLEAFRRGRRRSRERFSIIFS